MAPFNLCPSFRYGHGRLSWHKLRAVPVESVDISHNNAARRKMVNSSTEWECSSARQWLRNEDVGNPIVRCSQREVRISCLRLCRSVAIDGEKETRHNLKHATQAKSDERQGTRRANHHPRVDRQSDRFPRPARHANPDLGAPGPFPPFPGASMSQRGILRT